MRHRAVIATGTCGLFTALQVLSGCTWDLGDRVTNVETQLRALTAEQKLLPSQMETVRIELGTLEQEVKSREQRVLMELSQLRREDVAFLVERLDALTSRFQEFRREGAVTSASASDVHAASLPSSLQGNKLLEELDRMQQAVLRLAQMVDEMQAQQEQNFSASTAWLSGLAREIHETRKHR